MKLSVVKAVDVDGGPDARGRHGRHSNNKPPRHESVEVRSAQIIDDMFRPCIVERRTNQMSQFGVQRPLGRHGDRTCTFGFVFVEAKPGTWTSQEHEDVRNGTDLEPCHSMPSQVRESQANRAG